MPIRGIDQIELMQILKEHFTPSKEITSPDRLLGREDHLRRIARAFNSDGRNVFIFGDRGVGKTSVAVTAAQLNNFADETHIYVPCGTGASFGQVMRAIGNATNPAAQRLSPKPLKGGFNINVAGVGVGGSLDLDHNPTSVFPMPTNIPDALDILEYVSQTRRGTTIIVIDEFDRITSPDDRILFAELIKNLPPRNLDLRLILCGIANNVDGLLGAHLSVGRYLEPLELPKLPLNFLWDIIGSAARRADVKIPRDTIIRISIVSDGFPHFVHLIGDCLFWAMNDDPAEVVTAQRDHYEAAIKRALERTEHWLRSAYQKATEKTKNRLEYEEALWALADRTETRRQLKDIYTQSYKRIIDQRKLNGRGPMTREKLNARLLALRSDAHGNIVQGFGLGYYAFRENVLRGYVRLKAEAEGIELIPDPI